MNIAFFELEEWGQNFITNNFSNEHSFKFFKEILSKKHLEEISDCDIVCVFVHSKLNKKILDSLPNLKLICMMGSGYDHIDIVECERKKISVSNVPNYGGQTVAEFTFGLILLLSRKINRILNNQKYVPFCSKEFTGFDLKGKTIGIIGFGNIGSRVVTIAKGFGMNILVHTSNSSLGHDYEKEITFVSLNDLLRNSDIVSVHCPLNEKTKNLLNKDNLDLIKKGSIFINTARGGVVDNSALIDCLKSNRISAAGLDVSDEERILRSALNNCGEEVDKSSLQHVLTEYHMLRNMNSVVLTYHNAFNSKDALKRILSGTFENIDCFCQGNIKNKIT